MKQNQHRLHLVDGSNRLNLKLDDHCCHLCANAGARVDKKKFNKRTGDGDVGKRMGCGCHGGMERIEDGGSKSPRRCPVSRNQN